MTNKTTAKNVPYHLGVDPWDDLVGSGMQGVVPPNHVPGTPIMDRSAGYADPDDLTPLPKAFLEASNFER